jgi:hypothetical protein
MMAKRSPVEVYRRLVKIIRDENDWPTDHFLLDDELGALTWDLRDNTFAETLIEIEHAFGLPKSALDVDGIGDWSIRKLCDIVSAVQ